MFGCHVLYRKNQAQNKIHFNLSKKHLSNVTIKCFNSIKVFSCPYIVNTKLGFILHKFKGGFRTGVEVFGNMKHVI